MKGSPSAGTTEGQTRARGRAERDPAWVLPDRPPSALERAQIAERGGSFDFLRDEPELYGPDDGDPIKLSIRA